jgi:hypothetical protein
MDSTVAVAPRRSYLQQLNQAAQEVAKEFEDKLRKASSGVTRIQWEVGTRTAEVVADEAKYGNNAVQHIAAYLGYNLQAMYDMMQVANTFTLEDAVALTSTPQGNGKFMTFSHLVTLSRLEDSKARTKLAKRAIAESYSVHDLEAEIRSGASGTTRRPSGGGRPPKIPKTTIAGLQVTQQLAQKMTNWFHAAEKNVFPAIDAVTADSVTPTLVNKAETTLAAAITASEGMEKMISRLRTNLKHLQAVASEAKKEEASEPKTDKPKVKKKDKGKKDKGKKDKNKPKAKVRKPPAAAV